MDDRWDNQVKEYGAINITGFRIVDTSRPIVRHFLRGWEKLDPAQYPGAGKSHIQVTDYYLLESFDSSLVFHFLNIFYFYVFFFMASFFFFTFKFKFVFLGSLTLAIDC